MKNIIIASTSTIHGTAYLEYLFDELKLFYNDIDDILFIPYARPNGISHDTYTEIATKGLSKIGRKVKGLHTFQNPETAIKEAKAIFVGGGNTFVLLNELYKKNLITSLKQTIKKGIPYLGTSAGSNICGLSIKTTNDMPIVFPKSLNALGVVPFNINPHYIDVDTTLKHMGESRETRINEFHKFNTQPVIGLREGSWLKVDDGSIKLKGTLNARIFEYNKEPYEIETETELNTLK
ncbi:(alpha)-aspartyl dipeptidase [Pseudalgibacter alginicilyticus]|uniref:(Alpha)-aspartyl dipeptidase n=1 Tax=Pseudalgibacter alginicilyticus TaxID=1736674 RepID=A0A0P0D5E9_9FLAO|nr:dipeptidase PepE [Pseudalgibacter alginicilyticus]ALJ06136.1 (alpha)-aspartyl dipeptidase [Pseudalgibacter alginicilyticus]